MKFVLIFCTINIGLTSIVPYRYNLEILTKKGRNISQSSNPPPRVLTDLGLIEGTVQKTYTGTLFYQFEGIPYAAPPIGDLRYEPPRDPTKWEGILKATVRTFCYQYNQYNFESTGNFTVKGDEDCLNYNVYTPTLNRNANLPVIIHIHGGAFMFGQGTEWRPDLILNKELVLVTINYRLGPLGFLSTEDNVIPGNLGLKDQQKALKWIKEQIHHFGGNPNSITIHGLSAGSASVQLHYILPGSIGLFNNGIAESGNSFNNWVLMERAAEKTRQLADIVGCPTHNSTAIKHCLKTKPARLIVQSVNEFQTFLYNPFSPWGVVVDGDWSSDPVLPEHPLKLLLKKKIYDVPLLASFVTSEGLYPADTLYSKDEYLREVDTKWNEIMPQLLMYNDTIDHSIIDDVSQKIRRRYLGSAVVDKKSFSGLVQAVSDRTFVADIEKGLRLHSAGVQSKVYCYMYNYRGNTSIADGSARSTDNIGVSHGDDTNLILRHTTMKPPATPGDIAMSNLLLEIVTSFMAKGKPNIFTSWEPISKNVQDPLKLLKINGFNDIEALELEFLGQRHFWDSIPFNENERLLNITLGF